MRYQIEAGRLITRDGKPLVTLMRDKDVSPVDADQFTYEVVRAVNMHEELLEDLQAIVDCFSTGWEDPKEVTDALIPYIMGAKQTIAKSRE